MATASAPTPPFVGSQPLPPVIEQPRGTPHPPASALAPSGSSASATAATASAAVCIGNVPPQMTPELLTELLIQFGPLEAEVRFLKDANGVPKGIAFCDYADARSALYAMAALDGLELAGGRRLRANPANSKGQAPPPILTQLHAIACNPRPPAWDPPDVRERRGGEGSGRDEHSTGGYGYGSGRNGYDARSERDPRGSDRSSGRDERHPLDRRPRSRSRSPPYAAQRRVQETRWQPRREEAYDYSYQREHESWGDSRLGPRRHEEAWDRRARAPERYDERYGPRHTYAYDARYAYDVRYGYNERPDPSRWQGWHDPRHARPSW